MLIMFSLLNFMPLNRMLCSCVYAYVCDTGLGTLHRYFIVYSIVTIINNSLLSGTCFCNNGCVMLTDYNRIIQQTGGFQNNSLRLHVFMIQHLLMF